MARRPKSYLRTERLRHALSQEEIASLLGLSKDAISKYELNQRPISAKIIIAGEVLFGMRASALFPHLYKELQDGIGRRSAKLLAKIAYRNDRSSQKKRRLLSKVPSQSVTIDP